MKFKTPKSNWKPYLKIWTPTIYPQSYPWVPRLMGSTLNPVYLAKRVYDIVELPISNPQNIVTDLMGHPVNICLMPIKLNGLGRLTAITHTGKLNM